MPANVDIEELRVALNYLRQIELHQLEDIRWIGQDGVEVKLDPKIIQDFKRLGLANRDFAKAYLLEWGAD